MPATLSRRSFLHRAGLVGGTAVVVCAGGVSYRAYDRGVFEAGEGGAYDAWRDWEQGQGPVALVSAAILAANPHDSQAWVFRTTPSSVDVFADRTRALGTTDPFDREMYVGLGCALEVDAARAITDDEQQSRDSFKLFRSSWDDIQRHKDGLTLDTQGLSALTTAAAKLLPAPDRKAGDKFWIDQTRNTHTKTAAAYGIVAVPDAGASAHRLTGGRLLERIHLWAAANGIAPQHMNQITERADRERQLRLPPRFGTAVQALIPDEGWEPLVAFRVGYAKGDDGRRRSPRRPAGEVVA